MLFACYFFGVYWYLFSETLYIFYQGHEHGEGPQAFDDLEEKDEHHNTWVYYEHNWDILNEDLTSTLITNIYFATTTLSTVGFGDYYPVDTAERLLGAFLLYFGQAGFNFLVIQFLDVMNAIQRIDKGPD